MCQIFPALQAHKIPRELIREDLGRSMLFYSPTVNLGDNLLVRIVRQEILKIIFLFEEITLI